jgi:oligopeptide transport system ATP-binding protein
VTRVLDIEGLEVRVPAEGGHRTVVANVDLHVDRGEIVGIAGESGSGKTLTALSILGLLPRGAQVSGSCRFDDAELIGRPAKALREIRGRRIGMVFQDPMTSLHPMLSVERQLTEHVRHHLKVGKAEARELAAQALADAHVPNPEAALRAYPHQFSGGMRQRIAIALALACRPTLLIADEPTTALDVTVQAGILRLLKELGRSAGLSVVIVTHDLGVISALTDRLYVVYAGRVVESGATRDLIQHPRHPYTRGLLDCLPSRDDEALVPIPGSPPATLESVEGSCPFHPRCPHAQQICVDRVPPLEAVPVDRALACLVDPYVPGDRQASRDQSWAS